MSKAAVLRTACAKCGGWHEGATIEIAAQGVPPAPDLHAALRATTAAPAPAPRAATAPPAAQQQVFFSPAPVALPREGWRAAAQNEVPPPPPLTALLQTTK